MAAGEATLAAGVLIGSTILTVALAGPVLALEAGRAGFSPGGIVASLALVVALPLAAGVALRASVPPTGHRRAERAATRIALRAWASAASRVFATPRAERAASRVALAAVAALAALVASEVRLSAGYAAATAALVVFMLASAAVGRLLGLRVPRPAAAALLLTTSMRDFAIAAALAAAAFGPAAAAPLGLYGILVLVWGTAAAGVLRPAPNDLGTESDATRPITARKVYLSAPKVEIPRRATSMACGTARRARRPPTRRG
jgi:predicted Na+-dependent transporter